MYGEKGGGSQWGRGSGLEGLSLQEWKKTGWEGGFQDGGNRETWEND